MEEFKTYKLGDLVNVNTEQYNSKDNWKKALYLDTGNITENRIDEIQEFECSALPSRARRKVKHGDIVFSTVRPNQKHYGYIVNPASNLLVSTGFAVLSAKHHIADSKFLYYWLSQNEIIDYLHNIAEQSVSAYPSIKASDICDLDIELPSLEYQSKVASILSSIDDKIQLNRRINDNLEQQAQALFKSWFVDFEPFNDGEFIESELGMIPKGWRILCFKDFISPSSEKTGLENIPEYSVTNTGIIPRDSKFKKQLSKSTSKNKILRKNNLVFGMSREILNWGIMEDSIGGVSSAYNVYIINEQLVNPIYLRYYMSANIDYFKDLIGTAAREGQALDKGALAQKLIILPPDDVLENFLVKDCLFKEKIHKCNSELLNLTDMRDSLLPKLMSGELKINDLNC